MEVEAHIKGLHRLVFNRDVTLRYGFLILPHSLPFDFLLFWRKKVMDIEACCSYLLSSMVSFWSCIPPLVFSQLIHNDYNEVFSLLYDNTMYYRKESSSPRQTTA
jgi:hypothetical protein